MRPIVWLAFAVSTFASAGRAAAAPTVDIETRDGRTLRGVVDARTDDARLWIRQDEGGIALAASTAWEDVVKATLDKTPIEPQDLRKRAGDASSAAPRWYAEVEVPPRAPALPLGATVVSRDALAQGGPHVRSVEIVEACLVNLDRDVEPDGIRVSIAAIGNDGGPVAVRGSLSARLFGERRPATVSTDTFGELDRWSQPVRATDFVDGVATYELRFRRTAPEFQFDLLPDAVIDVQLGAFGEGDYAASAPVLIRQFNPMRDNQQLAYGTRFMPQELHGREPVSMPTRQQGRWIHWTH